MREGASTCTTFFVGLQRGSEIVLRATGNVLGGLSVVVVRVLLLTEIFVDAALDGFPLDVVVLDFVTVDDGAEGLVDAFGRVARVAVRGGMEMEAVSWRCVFWLYLVMYTIFVIARDYKARDSWPASSPEHEYTLVLRVNPPSDDLVGL